MNSTIAIIGAGPGMGAAIARTFGAQGFNVALIARNRTKLDALVANLAAEDITAAGFTADVLDPDSLRGALAAAEERFGGIDVLEHSPSSSLQDARLTLPSQTTPAAVQQHLEFQFYSALTATEAVLPHMRERGSGTLLFTTGAGSVEPVSMLANVNAAHAALRNWVLNLHNELAEDGIQAAHVAIGVFIGDEAPDGYASAPADRIAPVYWDLHTKREQAEIVFTGIL
ncbi:SDR family NAD(P)-dependent oxidoreductase [Humibacter ginsengisoli]